MTTRVLSSAFLLSAALVLAGCATAPDSRTSLLERKFQQTARHYEKFQHEGRTVYCRKGAVPECLTEKALRQQVEEFQRDRNAVAYTRSPPG